MKRYETYMADTQLADYHDLESRTLTPRQARSLIAMALHEFDLPRPVKVRFANRFIDRGWYLGSDPAVLKFGKTTNVAIVLHELAHHYTWAKLTPPTRGHGRDFAQRLEMLIDWYVGREL